jgi:hypothetical protein
LHEFEPDDSEDDPGSQVKRQAKHAPRHPEHLGEATTEEVGCGRERSQSHDSQEVGHCWGDLPDPETI